MAITPQDWIEKRVVESYDVDPHGRLRPHVLFSYLLNSAWNHAKGSAYGYSELAERNLMWVLIKFQMLIRDRPKWNEQLTIETWGKRIERLYALRDFRVCAPFGATLVSATSSWLILDRSTGRPQRFDAREDGFPWQPLKEEMETSLEKVAELPEGKHIATFRVRFSDIDVNRHVGSARYLQWIMDSHSHERLENAGPQAIDLNYLTEAMLDDEVRVYSDMGGDRELCSLRRASDNKELCRAQIKWGGAGSQ
jgi:medium-chain acyl-[acyl-carrier-protein] hydrolase